MRFAYADPPYLGQGVKSYAKHHPEAGVWDDPRTHRGLVERLCDEWPDGWAMSLSSPSLKTILPMCPDDVRVAAWVKPFCIFKPNVGLAYAWEPVILRGGRRITRDQPTIRDWVSATILVRKGLTGAKPPDFTLWLISALNMTALDYLDDLFPGTGIVTETWEKWRMFQ